MELEAPTSAALNELLRSITTAQDFVLAQAPDYFQQLIVLQYTKTLFIVFLAAVLCFFCAKFWSQFDGGESRSSIYNFTGAMICSIAAPIVTIIALLQIYNCFVAYFAPKVYIVDHIVSLLHGSGK